MNYWVISDTHFGNSRLEKINSRPKDFEQRILSFISKNVKKEDILINLGDLVMGGDADWCVLYCLAVDCKKWLVLGNHDSHTVQWYIEKGFDAVMHSFTLNMFGHKILFSHEPQPDIGRYTLNIHGHLHNFTRETIQEKDPEVWKALNNKQFLIALEDTNYQALTLKSIVEKFNKVAACTPG